MQALGRLWAAGVGEGLALHRTALEPCCQAVASTSAPSGRQDRHMARSAGVGRAAGGQKHLPPADPAQWLQRRQQARPATRGLGASNPYSKVQEPEPWSVVHARLMAHAVRNRPQNKRRMVWDRHIAREKQKMVRSCRLHMMRWFWLRTAGLALTTVGRRGAPKMCMPCGGRGVPRVTGPLSSRFVGTCRKTPGR